MELTTFNELFAHHDWATNLVMTAARGCSPAALDRPFEMGEGSLRATLQHLWEAESVWLDRWTHQDKPVDPPADLAELTERMAETAQERHAWLQTADFSATLTYRKQGSEKRMPLGVSVLHVNNHAVHHRAQALNMLKRLEVKPPRLDYIAMRASQPPLALADTEVLELWWAQNDWAFRQVFDAASPLSDEARRHDWSIGAGSLYRIMRHLADAPAWWMDSLANGPTVAFPKIDESAPWDALWEQYDQASSRVRTALQGDMSRTLTIPRGDVFALPVVLVQICSHGTHHRAQALNMLRHSGATVPTLDVAHWQLQGRPTPDIHPTPQPNPAPTSK